MEDSSWKAVQLIANKKSYLRDFCQGVLVPEGLSYSPGMAPSETGFEINNFSTCKWSIADRTETALF